MPVIKSADLADFVRRIFQAAGVEENTARLVADSLVTSDLAGHESHGIIRVPQYLERIAAGMVDPTAEPVITQETPVITMVDAQRSFGQVAARFAMSVTIKKAQTQGLAATGLFNSAHVGRLGEWVEMAADEGLIGLAFCNCGGPDGLVAPYGSTTRLLSTNPFAAAVPMAGRSPLVIDFATSVVAAGKLQVARNRNQSVPAGWIVRSDGQPSTSPNDFFAGGALLPAAGHKGYGLSLLIECLGGILTGHGCVGLPHAAKGNGVLFVVLSIEAFRPLEAFLADGAVLYEHVKTAPPTSGFDEVLLPGEPEQRSTEHRRAEGIPIDETTWAQLIEAAAARGVAVPN